jgi:TonB family protein
MNRLQKKCFIASAGLHLLLISILVICPAFLSTKTHQDEMEVLDFVPAKTVDALVSGGGRPDAKPLAPTPTPQPKPIAQPPAPAPKPQEPVKPPEPEPEPQPKAPDPEGLLQSKETRKKKPEINTKLITRRTDDVAKRRADAESREQQRAATAVRQRLARQIGEMADSLRDEVSGGGISMDLKGPGGGGLPYANFLQSVMSVYKRAWSGTVPNDATDDDVSAEASVTIARSGKVVDWNIVHSSGRPAVDSSVRAVLEKVTFAAPLPDDARENQRTVNITFEVNAKK